MEIIDQKIIPSIRSVQDLEKMFDFSYRYGVFLDIHISRLRSLYSLARENGKQMFLHIDLVQGLKSDEYATEYICQEIEPFGIISTKGNVILKAKQKKVKAIQRVFAIDSSSIEKSYSMINKINPDYIEILPGVVPKIIKEIKNSTGKQIFAGGLIKTSDEVEQAIEAGASAITTSYIELWKLYNQ
ncbi:glycerol-3-phosphate responsive antiterminator [Bacillus sp. RG28]|uniref:Glycerol uptake operon antiterminator regulatory protein n=1 Tax=Gottfriedia endophytica TaxID=2820819 RepID=A0A940SGT3_9BACI|nr:glycerol-3-phosphate responsive antiterminator [Gottfriedia endophytica]MBP0725432.1 glycerol-3-phosphate responsive antiterminator [Gottfriedia endophytica]